MFGKVSAAEKEILALKNRVQQLESETEILIKKQAKFKWGDYVKWFPDNERFDPVTGKKLPGWSERIIGSVKVKNGVICYNLNPWDNTFEHVYIPETELEPDLNRAKVEALERKGQARIERLRQAAVAKHKKVDADFMKNFEKKRR